MQRFKRALFPHVWVYGMLMFWLGVGYSAPAKAAVPKVTVSGRKLLINGQAYTVQGVNYSPVPVGSTLLTSAAPCIGPYTWWTNAPTYIADFPLMHKLGANTIRTFNLMNSTMTPTQVLQALDNAQANGLYVIMGYSAPTYQSFNSSTAQMQSEILTSVANYKSHPAVLMWMIGNEVNLTQPEGGDPTWSSSAWYNFLESIAAQIKAIDPNHPVGSAEGEIPNVWGFNIGNAGVQAGDAQMTALDLWGANIYRGKTFEGFIQTLGAATAKPLLITEFGKDAWHDSINAEDQDMQASYLSPQWQEIAANLSAAGAGTADLVGGAVFEWTDEWWKDSGAGTSCFTHDTQVGFTRTDDPIDPNYQEEWFGITSVDPVNPETNPNGTTRVLRKGFLALQSFWNPSITSPATGPSTFFTDTVRNFPNPFPAGIAPTKFVAYVNEAGTIRISIYDASSQFVTSLPPVATTGPGRYEIVWDGKTHQGNYVSAGLYFARIEGQSVDHQEKQFRRVVAVK